MFEFYGILLLLGFHVVFPHNNTWKTFDCTITIVKLQLDEYPGTAL